MKDGWTINASKTVNIPVGELFVSHERLPDADTAGEMKAYWRAALAELKALRE